jgi:hypothetical protein
LKAALLVKDIADFVRQTFWRWARPVGRLQYDVRLATGELLEPNQTVVEAGLTQDSRLVIAERRKAAKTLACSFNGIENCEPFFLSIDPDARITELRHLFVKAKKFTRPGYQYAPYWLRSLGKQVPGDNETVVGTLVNGIVVFTELAERNGYRVTVRRETEGTRELELEFGTRVSAIPALYGADETLDIALGDTGVIFPPDAVVEYCGLADGALLTLRSPRTDVEIFLTCIEGSIPIRRSYAPVIP